MGVNLIPVGPLKRVQRLRQIAQALRRQGFGSLIYRLSLGQLFPWTQRVFRTPTLEQTPEGLETLVGRRLVLVLEELGPTFVKLGQILSSRPDLLPPALIMQLRRLQDDVAPFDSELARQVIEQDLQMPLSAAFSHIDAEPFASGSIAQTYHAVTNDGQQVVVKVKRPDIEHTVRNDVSLLRWLANRAEMYIPELRVHNPRLLVAEFWRTINRELDMINEAAMTDRFHREYADNPHIRVPRVRWDLTSSKVLTITRIPGMKFHRALQDGGASLDRTTMAHQLVNSFLDQYFELGTFHADPHPGNILIEPPDKLGVVDFGMVGHLDRRYTQMLAVLVTATVRREFELVVDILSEMSAIDQKTDTSMLKRDLAELVEKYYGLPLKRLNIQTIFVETTDLARQHHIRLPRDLILLGRSMMTLGGVALDLDAQLNIPELIAPKLRKLLYDRIKPSSLSQEANVLAYHLANMTRDVPAQSRELIRRALRGQLHGNLNVPEIGRLADEVDRSSNRLSFSIVIAAIIVGSSLLYHAEVGPTFFQMPALGLAGYLVAAIMGLWLVIAIFRSGKLS